MLDQEQLSLQSEIHSSIRAKKKHKSPANRHLQLDSSTDMSGDSDLESTSTSVSSASGLRSSHKFHNAFATYKLATANKMHIGGLSSTTPDPIYNPGLGSSLETKVLKIDDDMYSYTISRDNSQSPTAFMMDLDAQMGSNNTKTFDTLTMTPAGAASRSRPIPNAGTTSRSLFDERLSSYSGSNFLDTQQLARDEAEGEFSIPELGSGEDIFLPGLGSLQDLTNGQSDAYAKRGRLGSISTDFEPETSSPLRPMRGALGSVPAGLGSVPARGQQAGNVPGRLPLGSVPGGIPLGSVLGDPRPLGSIPGDSSRRGMGSVPAGLGTVPGEPGFQESLSGDRAGGPGYLGTRRSDLGSVPGGLHQGAEGTLGSIPLGTVPSQEEQARMMMARRPGLEGLSRIRPDLGRVPFAFEDSGIESSEFQDLSRPAAIQGQRSLSGSDSIPELEEALANLSPQEVEQRRKRMFSMSRYSFELGSDGFNSPGSSIFGKPGFNLLPYGVRTPDSLMSTGSRDMLSGSGYGYGGGWKLPDKLRIVKPLEGSLTLNQWQRLAKPSLGGIFEERKGVVIRGSRINAGNLVITEEDQISDLEDDNNEDEAAIALRLKAGATRLEQTMTNSRIMHPDVTDVTSSYRSGSRMSTSMQSSVRSSRRGSMYSSMDDLRMDFGTSTWSTNIGLSGVLNERNIHGGSTFSLDMGHHSRMGSMSDLSRIYRSGSVSEVASVSSLTPSVVHTPDKTKSFSPTGTPLNSPTGSRSGSPTRKQASDDNPGFVLGFFASLRTALYGEQRKEVLTLKKKEKKVTKAQRKKLGILDKVHEVGPERFLSPSPMEGDSSDAESDTPSSIHHKKSVVRTFNKDWNELLDIAPGTLTMSRGIKARKQKDPELFGELKPPDPRPQGLSGRGPGRIFSPGDKAPPLPGAFGVPGRTGTGAVQRSDLGSVPMTSQASLVANADRLQSKPAEDTSFIGTLASMFFGRKGGLL